MMKRAVESLFNNEVYRNCKVSSHSQLERWIIEELKQYSPSDSAMALQKIMYEIRGINFDIDEPKENDIDAEVGNLVRRYLDYGLHMSDTGGGCTAFRWSNEDGSHYALVTTEGGCDVPSSLDDPVQFGFYNESDDMLYHKEFKTSIDMFSDRLITYLIDC
jgi:hypothetical protein